MILPRHSRLLVILGTALLVAGSPLRAIDLDGLVKNSPFGAAAGKAAEEGKPGTLEFRGMYADKGVMYYSIYNSTTKQSVWVKQGETAEGAVPFVVKGYDADNEAVVLETGGQPVKVALHTSTVTNFTGAAPAALPPQTAGTAVTAVPAGGVGFNNGQGPTPEQIQAFRDEMRRRFSRGGPGGPGGDANGATADGGDNRALRRERNSDANGGAGNAANTAGTTRTKKSK